VACTVRRRDAETPRILETKKLCASAALRQRIIVLFAWVLLAASPPVSAQQEVIAVIQVHGNTITPSEEIISASGLEEGSPFSESMRAEAEARLRSSRQFHEVDVLKRYASISDPTQITVVIQVDEGPVRIDLPVGPPGVPSPGRVPLVSRRGPLNVMFAPILNAEDGYGLTYGARFAITGHRNTQQRVVIPLSWGGDKRAGVEFQKDFRRRVAPDIRVGGFIQRRTHPFFDSNADRKRVLGRADWALTRSLRAGTEIAWQDSTLVGEHVEARSIGTDLVVDTRIDPLMPHNAVYARASAERLRFSSSSAVRTDLEANGYIGLYRGMVLALRAVRENMSEPAPAFYKSLLGGADTLRGFPAGYRIGDTIVAGSVELRIPLSSALRVARIGTSVFMDAGTAYDKGGRLSEQKFDRGVGAGVWATAPLFRISLMVARGLGSGTRVHFGAGLMF
jgi:Omp85 superfamily domain/Surface antigen variable number repeat